MIPILVSAQLNNHWSQNFNDESSLLSGAVVGGGGGPSAIYYNPATISEINESKLSLNASLFSFDFLNAKNAYGENIDFYNSRSYVIPRFLSYMLKPKNHSAWSFEVAFLNVANQSVDGVNYTDKNIDILSRFEGQEKYTAFSKYTSRYRDDWIGIGGSVKAKEKLYLGGSMFASFLSQHSYHTLQIDAQPSYQSISNPEQYYYIASYQDQELVKFNDYRLLWKFGALYIINRISFGINLTTPVWSKIYSDGKRVMRKRSQNNITDPESGEFKGNFLIIDYAEKKQVSVQTKTAFSIAAGFTYYNENKTKILYSTFEYFAKINPYVIAKADPTFSNGSNPELDNNEFIQWLSFVEGAKPVFNVGIGYKWYIKENLMLLAGFKTDFNFKKDYDLKPYWRDFTIKSFNFNKYHFTGGSTLNIFGQDITAGIQYTLGYLKNMKQIANLSDPVEFNEIEKKALQGTRMNVMNTIYNSVSIYVAATFNFGSGNKNKDVKN